MFENHPKDLHWISTFPRQKICPMSTKTFLIDFQTLWTSKFLSKMPQDCCEQFWAKAKMTMMCYFQQWAIELTMQQLDFFSSHFPRKRTPHALFSNSSSHQKSSRRVSTGAVCWYRNSGAVAGSFSPCLPLPPPCSGSSDVLSADFAVFHETYSSAGHQKGGQSYI